MIIVHTEASCGWGGQEIRILDEARGLIERGHYVMLVCPREARIYDEALARGVPVVALPIGRKRLAGLLALRRWLYQTPIDIVNTHSSTDSWLVALACATLRRPPAVVRTRHISAPVPNNGPTRWLYGRACAMIVTTGERLRETLMRDNHLDGSRIVSIPTGIDTKRFHPASPIERVQARSRAGLLPGEFVVGIIATLRSWKGHRYLIEAIRLLNAADVAPERRLRLLIVGDGPQRAALEEQVWSAGLTDSVVFAGNRHDVEHWMHACDLFVLPSYANEGVPQALMQAMLSGLCCVTTNVGSIGEIARHGVTACVVPVQDADALAETIKALMRNDALRESLGTAARNWCVEHNSRERMLDAMEAVFHKVEPPPPRLS